VARAGCGAGVLVACVDTGTVGKSGAEWAISGACMPVVLARSDLGAHVCRSCARVSTHMRTGRAFALRFYQYARSPATACLTTCLHAHTRVRARAHPAAHDAE